jgi:phosphoribosylglycinamide formyltransferase-1
MAMVKIGVLASGRGSNFQAIIDSSTSGRIKSSVVMLIVDNPSAYALKRAEKHNIPSLYINPKDFGSKDAFYRKISDELKARGVGLVVLAGFMRIVGKPLLDAFPMKVMNIHPALLPSFPGLHGQKQAVDYGARISGCTVHFVDEGVDTGPIIIQAAVPVHQDDTEETLSARILEHEHRIFPEAIRLFEEGRLEVTGRWVKVKGAALPPASIVNPPL